jgi:hypothetical protein
VAGPEGAKNQSGKNVLPLIQIRLGDAEAGEITLGRQDNSAGRQIAPSGSTNAGNFSSARTTKRFPSPAMCVSNPDRSLVEINR